MIQNLANETLLITHWQANLMSANSNCKGARTKLGLPTNTKYKHKKGTSDIYIYLSLTYPVWLFPVLFPSSSQCVPQDVPNSITLLSHNVYSICFAQS
jgi:hypothetical protein